MIFWIIYASVNWWIMTAQWIVTLLLLLLFTKYLGYIDRLYDLILAFLMGKGARREDKLKHMKWRGNKILMYVVMKTICYVEIEWTRETDEEDLIWVETKYNLKA